MTKATLAAKPNASFSGMIKTPNPNGASDCLRFTATSSASAPRTFEARAGFRPRKLA